MLSSSRSLILHSQATINLGNLWAYNKLTKGAAQQRQAFTKLMTSVSETLEFYAQDYPELVDELNRLRLDIRLVSKGVPITVPLDSASSHPVLTHEQGFSEQQYNAFTLLLRSAYKKVAMLCHPDRPGGSSELFKELTEAFETRDLTKITLMYTELSAGRNLYWQQSEQAVDHASTELARPQEQLKQLKSAPAFAIARYHVVGAFAQATKAMERQLKNEIVALLNELQYLTRNQNENECQSSTSEDLEQNQGSSQSESSEVETGAN